jgi:fibronectin type III domain protein/uncharacterized protein DUF11
MILLLGFAAGISPAQTSIAPSTFQIAGTPDPQSPVTAPNGGVVLYGSALNPANQPVRHLWVADGASGICRIDPDLDSPGPYAINPATCAFQLNGSRITGGGMALDPVNNLLYFADPKQGIFRMAYVAAGDNGNGLLDYTTLFGLGGNISGSVFPAGQTGCALPGAPSKPGSAALDPQGNLWVGFAGSASILRFNRPVAATTNFGTCQSFIQAVATTPNNRAVNGLAWIGHDLWGASAQSPFVIRNADTACLISPNPACSPGNGTVVAMLPALSPTSLAGDQLYPATTGDNLYFGTASGVAWLANAGAPAANQTLTAQFPDPSISMANVGAVVVDATDPANLIVYDGDDPSAVGTTGAGRWFQTIQAASAFDVPGAPLHVVAAGDDSQATVSWSPAQAAQPVNSYTVHNSFASNGAAVPDVIVNPAGNSPYPPLFTTITGLTNGVSYQFQVAANNSAGSSAYSDPSNTVTPPGLVAPGVPGGQQAIAGDAQAYVSWTPPANASIVPIDSYTVSALQGGTATGVSVTVAGSAVNAVVSGLTNGKSYTFTVHATNAAGSSGESAQSNSVTPLPSNLPVMKVEVNGPGSVTVIPTLVTYQVVVTNTSIFPVTNIIVNDVLSTSDGAFIVSGQPSQGFCTAGGSGVTNIVCALGSMAGQQIVTINVTAQMQGRQIADTARVTGTDANGDSLVFKIEHRATSPPGTPPPTSLPSISVPVSASATPTGLHPGQSGTITWTIQDTTTTAANDVVFFITVDNGLTVNSINASPSSGANPASCTPLFAGLINTNGIVCEISSLGGPQVNGVNPVQVMTVQLGVTAPNRTGLTFLPSGSVTFLGIDSSQSTATVQLKVN